MELLWVRHGENVANDTRTLSHSVFDGDLTERGRLQAAATAERLAALGQPVGPVFCSPLKRARQTAAIIAARLRLQVSDVLPGFRELDVGELDGRSDDDAWLVYERVLASWAAGDPQVRFPGGEDALELTDRLRSGLLQVVVASPEGSLPVVVAHGANLRAALPWLTGEDAPGSDLPTGGWARLSVDHGRAGQNRVALASWEGPRGVVSGAT